MAERAAAGITICFCFLSLVFLTGCPRKLDNEFSPDMTEGVNRNKPELIERSLKEGYDPDVQMHDGTTYLHGAAGMGHVEAVRALLEGGADPNIRDNNGRTPLHSIMVYDVDRKQRVDMLKLMLKHNGDIGIKDNGGLTPLDIARQKNRTEALKILDPEGSSNEH
jgi:cytohesin